MRALIEIWPQIKENLILDCISQVEVLFSSNLYSKDILSSYSTTNKIYYTIDPLVDNLVYTVAYTFMHGITRNSFSTHTNQGVKLSRTSHTKCASVFSQIKKAKYAFNYYKIGQEETINRFVTRSEQRVNEARNYDMRISNKKLSWTLLHNMKYHRYDNELIASFATNFELNQTSIT